MWRRSRVKSFLALATARSLLLPAPLLRAPTGPVGQAAGIDRRDTRADPKPSSAAAQRLPAARRGMAPHLFDVLRRKLVLYQPQVASWDRQQHMVAYSAVSFLPKGAEKAQLGTVKVESDTVVAVSERLVRFPIVKVTEATFATLDRDQLREVVTQITDRIPDQERVIALDRVLASVEKSQIIPREVSGVKADPPAIFYSTTPAVLVNIDGEPIWSPIKDNDLKFAVNTNWDLFQLESSKTFYLRHEQSWLKASDVKGPWSPAGTLPASFSKLPPDENWKDVKAALPGKTCGRQVAADRVRQHDARRDAAASRRAQLPAGRRHDRSPLGPEHGQRSVSRGQDRAGVLPRRRPVVLGAGLHRPVDVCHDVAARGVPENSARASALAGARRGPGNGAGGGSRAARAGAADRAREEEGAEGARGRPIRARRSSIRFRRPRCRRRVNTDKQIIKVGDLYYMCFQGVWFVAKAPEGPWEVTGTVPKEIYEIPASSLGAQRDVRHGRGR